jgi:hypothetical protein
MPKPQTVCGVSDQRLQLFVEGLVHGRKSGTDPTVVVSYQRVEAGQSWDGHLLNVGQAGLEMVASRCQTDGEQMTHIIPKQAPNQHAPPRVRSTIARTRREGAMWCKKHSGPAFTRTANEKKTMSALRPAEDRPEGRFRCLPGCAVQQKPRPEKPTYGPEAFITPQHIIIILKNSRMSRVGSCRFLAGYMGLSCGLCLFVSVFVRVSRFACQTCRPLPPKASKADMHDVRTA